MKIASISIKNFRSIEFAKIECDDFNIFVGQNNAGKTNIFEAVEWFYKGTPKGKPIRDFHFQRDTDREIVVEITYVGAIHGAKNMRNEVNQTKMLQVLDGSDAITVRRSSRNDNKRSIDINGIEVEKLPTGFDKAFNDFLPQFEFIHTRQYFDELAKYSAKTPVGIMLASVLEEILQENAQYRAFKDKFSELFDSDESAIKVEFDRLGSSVKLHLERQFSECSRVNFLVSSPEFDDLLKGFQTTIDDGVETYAHEKGDGMQRALMLAIIQAYAEFRKGREDAGKSFLFFIDEAELHLHPTAQRRLKEVLIGLSSNLDQVFINTHSSVFVADDHPHQRISKVEKVDSCTSVHPVSAFDKPYVVYELLGGNPADLLLPRNFIIVEGPSEVELLSRVIKRFYPERPAVHILSAEGDTHQAKRSINAIRKAYGPLQSTLYGSRVIVLCDAPSDVAMNGFKEFIKEFKDLKDRGQIHVLPKGSLEECYPDENGWRKTSEEVSAMNGKAKLKLAKAVGDQISLHQFEKEMSSVCEALSAAWKLAH